MPIKRLSIVLFVLLHLFGCSTPKPTVAHQSSYFDFTAVTRYSTFPRNSSFYEQQSLADDMRNNIEWALERDMGKRGVHYVALKQAEMIISYHLLDDDQRALANYNKLVHLCVRCGDDGKAAKREGIAVVPEGANRRQRGGKEQQQPLKHNGNIANGLIIDFIDPQTQRSVWRSRQQLQIKAQDNSQEVKAKVDAAIAQMLQQWQRQKGAGYNG